MIHHPLVLAPKIVFLLLIVVVLFILHGYLSADQFQIAVIISGVLFVCFVIVLWIVAAKMLRNADSKPAQQMVLSSQQRVEDGYRAAPDELKSLAGQCGVARTPLRPAGTAIFDGNPISVVADGDFIDPNTRVEVTLVQGSCVVVRKAPISARGREGAS